MSSRKCAGSRSQPANFVRHWCKRRACTSSTAHNTSNECSARHPPSEAQSYTSCFVSTWQRWRGAKPQVPGSQLTIFAVVTLYLLLHACPRSVRQVVGRDG